MKLSSLVLAVVSVLAATGAAWSQTADELYTQGIRLRQAGKDGQALEVFRKAQELAPSPKTQAQLALSLIGLKRWVEGSRELAQALATDDPSLKDRADFFQLALTTARKRIGGLTVSGPAGATVDVQGKEVGQLPLAKPVSLDEGTVTVTVTASGFALWKKDVEIVGRKLTRVSADLEPAPKQ